MIIFLTGMFRSGSTWSFNVARELLLSTYPRERIHISAINDTALTLLQAADQQRDLVLMKSHLLDHVGESLIRAHGAKAIHTFREPVDAIRSGRHAFGWSFEECLRYVARSFELMDLLSTSRNGCLIAYEDIARIPADIVRMVSEYLEVPVDDSTVQAIVCSLHVESVRGFTERLADEHESLTATRQTVDLGFSYYDTETLFHRRHVGPEGYQSSAALLTDAQLSEISTRFGARLANELSRITNQTQQSNPSL